MALKRDFEAERLIFYSAVPRDHYVAKLSEIRSYNSSESSFPSASSSMVEPRSFSFIK